ncbi:MAG: hypothetical protein HQL64_00335 [Magnetococcales bacterium]|nr:hypothetical protein [Magnetococcales bacterium]
MSGDRIAGFGGLFAQDLTEFLVVNVGIVNMTTRQAEYLANAPILIEIETACPFALMVNKRKNHGDGKNHQNKMCGTMMLFAAVGKARLQTALGRVRQRGVGFGWNL